MPVITASPLMCRQPKSKGTKTRCWGTSAHWGSMPADGSDRFARCDFLLVLFCSYLTRWLHRFWYIECRVVLPFYNKRTGPRGAPWFNTDVMMTICNFYLLVLHLYLLLRPGSVEVQSIVMSLSVCLCVRDHTSGTTCQNFTKFYALAAYGHGPWSSSDGAVIRYVLPVLWMTSCFHSTMDPVVIWHCHVYGLTPLLRAIGCVLS